MLSLRLCPRFIPANLVNHLTTEEMLCFEVVRGESECVALKVLLILPELHLTFLLSFLLLLTLIFYIKNGSKKVTSNAPPFVAPSSTQSSVLSVSSHVNCVALSQDNSYVVSGSKSGSIIVHSTSSNKVEYQTNNVFANGVYGLCYLLNGSLVACGRDGGLKVLSPSLELVQTLVGHDGSVFCVTVSPSGSHIASCGCDEKVIIWSEPGEGGEWARVQVLEDHTDGINAVCFSPDGKQLATGSDDKLINLYSFNEGSAILAHTLEGHTISVESLSFSPDCKLLCSGSVDESIKFWNPVDGSLVKSIDQAHTPSVSSVSYSPNGRVLVSADFDKTMKIWDAETFELKHTFEQEYKTNQITITADSNFIVSANYDKTVRITPCREYHLTGLTPILNLILHIVYKWEFVSFLEPSENTSILAKVMRRLWFLEPNENTSILEEVMRRLGECVRDGGYNVASEILSFLSPAHLPVQITPTRWKRDPEDIIARLRAENDLLRQRIAEYEQVESQREGTTKEKC